MSNQVSSSNSCLSTVTDVSYGSEDEVNSPIKMCCHIIVSKDALELEVHCKCGMVYFIKNRQVVAYKTSNESPEYPCEPISGAYFDRVYIDCNCGELYVVSFDYEDCFEESSLSAVKVCTEICPEKGMDERD